MGGLCPHCLPVGVRKLAHLHLGAWAPPLCARGFPGPGEGLWRWLDPGPGPLSTLATHSGTGTRNPVPCEQPPPQPHLGHFPSCARSPGSWARSGRVSHLEDLSSPGSPPTVSARVRALSTVWGPRPLPSPPPPVAPARPLDAARAASTGLGESCVLSPVNHRPAAWLCEEPRLPCAPSAALGFLTPLVQHL